MSGLASSNTIHNPETSSASPAPCVPPGLCVWNGSHRAQDLPQHPARASVSGRAVASIRGDIGEQSGVISIHNQTQRAQLPAASSDRSFNSPAPDRAEPGRWRGEEPHDPLYAQNPFVRSDETRGDRSSAPPPSAALPAWCTGLLAAMDCNNPLPAHRRLHRGLALAERRERYVRASLYGEEFEDDGGWFVVPSSDADDRLIALQNSVGTQAARAAIAQQRTRLLWHRAAVEAACAGALLLAQGAALAARRSQRSLVSCDAATAGVMRQLLTPAVPATSDSPTPLADPARDAAALLPTFLPVMPSALSSTSPPAPPPAKAPTIDAVTPPMSHPRHLPVRRLESASRALFSLPISVADLPSPAPPRKSYGPVYRPFTYLERKRVGSRRSSRFFHGLPTTNFFRGDLDYAILARGSCLDALQASWHAACRFRQVRIHGLVARPELNGVTGELLGVVDGRGRCPVRLFRGLASAGILIKPGNLALLGEWQSAQFCGYDTGGFGELDRFHNYDAVYRRREDYEDLDDDEWHALELDDWEAAAADFVADVAALPPPAAPALWQGPLLGMLNVVPWYRPTRTRADDPLVALMTDGTRTFYQLLGTRCAQPLPDPPPPASSEPLEVEESASTGCGVEWGLMGRETRVEAEAAARAQVWMMTAARDAAVQAACAAMEAAVVATEAARTAQEAAAQATAAVGASRPVVAVTAAVAPAEAARDAAEEAMAASEDAAAATAIAWAAADHADGIQ